jgi:hypothetical protein
MTPLIVSIYFGSSNRSFTEGNEIVIASIITLTACSSYIRYLHLSMALLFCLAVTAAVTYGIFELGVTENILPFVMMLFAIVLYFLSKTIKKISRTFYYKGILLANSFSLVLFIFLEIIL